MSLISSEMREVKGVTYCALTIGEVSGEIPRHLLSGEQECGYIYRDGTLSELYYSRIMDQGGMRSILYDTPLMIPVTEIGQRFPHQIKERFVELSQAMQAVPRTFFQNERGFIPSWRLYIFEEGGAALLPSRLSDLILYSASQKDRVNHINRYHRPDIHSPFALCHQLAQLLYLSLAGFAPFEIEEVRLTAYRPIPSVIAVKGLNAVSGETLDRILAMPISKQRTEVSGAYSASENLSWFDTQIQGLSFDRDEEGPPNNELGTYRSELMKKGQKREFWRKKGMGIAAVAVALIIILTVTIGALRRAAEPPYTAGMSAPQVIEEFFKAQNDLNIEQMNASLARGVSNPFEKEVTMFFVNDRVRMAYEQIDALITPEEFVASGGESIPATSMLYGVGDLTVTEKSDNTFLAEYLYYTPVLDSENTESSEVYRGTVVLNRVEFTLSDEKGYELITDIKELGFEKVKEIEIPYSR